MMLTFLFGCQWVLGKMMEIFGVKPYIVKAQKGEDNSDNLITMETETETGKPDLTRSNQGSLEPTIVSGGPINIQLLTQGREYRTTQRDGRGIDDVGTHSNSKVPNEVNLCEEVNIPVNTSPVFTQMRGGITHRDDIDELRAHSHTQVLDEKILIEEVITPIKTSPVSTGVHISTDRQINVNLGRSTTTKLYSERNIEVNSAMNTGTSNSKTSVHSDTVPSRKTADSGIDTASPMELSTDRDMSNNSNQNDLDLVDDSISTARLRTEEFDVTSIHGYRNMPFLSIPDTIDFISKSHTIFLMRGLPGSGKSTIVRGLQKIYPGAVVCSADDFFMDSEGNYNYDRTKISDAHKVCQLKATQNCEDNTRVIIIDNTNIQGWAMSHYVRLAQTSHFYHTLIVEPMTPWRYDVDVLATRNKHNVERTFISQKLQSLRASKYTPYYYGWFLNREDSGRLASRAHEVVKTCVDELRQGRQSTDVKTPLEEMFDDFENLYTRPKPMLHCTANYMARKGGDHYHSAENVKRAMGKTFKITISGFLFSKRAVCAKVDLYASTGKGETDSSSMETGSSENSNQGWETVQTARNVRKKFKTAEASAYANYDTDYRTSVVHETDHRSHAVNESDNSEDMLNLFVKEEEEKLRQKYEGVKRGEFYMEQQTIFRHGCSAHVTVAYAQSGEAKYSGDDILLTCEKQFHGNFRKYETSVGTVSAYDGEIYHVTLNQPIEFDCLFHGFYSTRSH